MHTPKISHAIIAMGSNLTDTAAVHGAFDTTMTALSELGVLSVSSVVVGADFTGRTQRIYHNWVAYVELDNPTDTDTLDKTLKQIEKDCGRTAGSADVPMDLDILAIHSDEWRIITKRLPLKAHELAGLQEVAPFLLGVDGGLGHPDSSSLQ